MPKKKASETTAPWEVTEDMFLSEPEVADLLLHVSDRERSATSETLIRATVDRLIIELLLFSGLRNSELCHLRVIDTIVGHGASELRVTSTPKQDRAVVIPQRLSDRIVSFVRDVRAKCLPGGSGNNDELETLILNERGRPYDRTALYRRVVRILTESGLESRASVQLLRHTCGYLSYKRTGGNLLFVQHQLGHAHPMVTAVYAQFVKFNEAELANRVGAELQLDESPHGTPTNAASTSRNSPKKSNRRR